jgi:hypothetical protein
MRCSLFSKYLIISIFIDASPDIKKKLIYNNIFPTFDDMKITI